MAKAVAPKTAVKPLSKTQLIAAIAESTKLAKKDVATVLDAVADQIKFSMSKKGPGAFMFPGLFKIEKKEMPKQPARKHVADPFHPGEFRDYPAKPASCKPKLRALKALKDMVK